MSTALSTEIYYISANEFQDAMSKGTWKSCRSDYYIRRKISQDSVNDKKRALVSLKDSASGEGSIKVLEPLVVQVLPDTSKEIISGNTRAEAILQLLQSNPCTVNMKNGDKGEDVVINITEFDQIPYRVFLSEITEDEAIDFQTSTNDHTAKHKPYDIAVKIKDSYERITALYANIKNKKEKSRAITNHICGTFKLSEQSISTFLKVVNNSTEYLKTFLDSEKITMDTASVLLNRFSDEGLKDNDVECDKLLTELWQYVRDNYAVANGEYDDDNTVITKRLVTVFFEDRKGLAEAKADESQSEIEQAANSIETEIVSEDAGTPSDSDDTTPALSEQEYLEKSEKVFGSYKVDTDDIKSDHHELVREKNLARLKFISLVMPHLVDGNIALSADSYLDCICDILMQNNTYIANDAVNSKKIPMSKLTKLLDNIEKSSEKLYNAVHEIPEIVSSTDSNTVLSDDPIATSQDIVIETDTHTATVS